MASSGGKASAPKRGRPRKPSQELEPEDTRIRLKKSTIQLWKATKERLGFKSLSNSDFAEMLLSRIDKEGM